LISASLQAIAVRLESSIAIDMVCSPLFSEHSLLLNDRS
jgi:hypothetical protein